MRRLLSVSGGIIGIMIAISCAAPRVSPPPAPMEQQAELPGAFELRRDLMVLASDSFRGREAGTADERRAADFLAMRAAAIGLTPAGDSGYLQRVRLTRTTLESARFTIRAAHGGERSIVGLRPLIDLGDDRRPIRRHAEGAVVFAGYGVDRPGHGDDLSRVPIAGRVVVLVNSAPTGAAAARRAQLESPAAIAVRLQRILPLHPAAVIILVAGASVDIYDAAGRAADHGTLHAADSAASSSEVDGETARGTPMILLGLPVRGSPLLPPRWPRDDRPQELTAGRFRGAVDVVRALVESYNVVASVPGHDSLRRTTWVALGAHFDHLGIQAAAHGDSVAHGADDDGSGCVALLAVARALIQGAPLRRSVLFIWHTGEEKGLLGSAYFVMHPTVAIDSIVAFVDADMIGRNTPESLYVVGPGAMPATRSRGLGTLVDSVNATSHAPFTFNRTWDVPTDPVGVYYRADSYPYAQHGVPVVLFTSGLHADYHQVTDVATRVNYAKLAHVAQLLYALTGAIANRETRP